MLKTQVYFEQGQNAYLQDKVIDDCPCRKPERRAAWLRGWYEAKLNSQNKAVAPMQQQKNLNNIAKLKQQLKQRVQTL